MKKCPYCAEEIQDEAIKCKHCGEMLSKPEEDDDNLCPACGTKNPPDAIYCSNKDCPDKVYVLPKGKRIVCPNPNCGYKGPPKTEARGNTAIGCLLCLFFLLPGIIYFIVRGGYRYVCPKCGLQLKSDN